jgi:hypothetical protein
VGALHVFSPEAPLRESVESGQNTPPLNEALGLRSSQRLQELDDGILFGAFQFGPKSERLAK